MSWKVIGQTAESSAPLPKHQALKELDDVLAVLIEQSIDDTPQCLEKSEDQGQVSYKVMIGSIAQNLRSCHDCYGR